MFEGFTYLFDLLDVSMVWPTIILIGLFLLCLLPYKPVCKIKESKDLDGNTVYTVWKSRN